MKPTTATGGLKPGTMQDLQQNIPELQNVPYNLEWEEFKPNGEFIDSSNANLEFYNQLGQEIAEKHEKYDGVVVIFGTDTMGPSAAAMSYQFEGLKRPVVFTGSMKPAVQEHSDGPRNLLDAIEVAAQSGNEIPSVNEVSVCFYGKLFRGTHARKYSAGNDDAFDGVGEEPIARIQENGIQVDEGRLLEEERGEFQFHKLEQKDVISIRVTGELASSIEEKLKVSSGVDAILLYDVPYDPPLTSESRFTKLVEKYAPGVNIFFADNNLQPPNSEWIRMRGVPDFQQLMVKANYILSRTDDRDEMKLLAEGNLRGEIEGDVTRENEVLVAMRAEKERPPIDRR